MGNSTEEDDDAASAAIHAVEMSTDIAVDYFNGEHAQEYAAKHPDLVAAYVVATATARQTEAIKAQTKAIQAQTEVLCQLAAALPCASAPTVQRRAVSLSSETSTAAINSPPHGSSVAGLFIVGVRVRRGATRASLHTKTLAAVA